MKWLLTIVQLILTSLRSSGKPLTETMARDSLSKASADALESNKEQKPWEAIDWTNPIAKVSKYFSVHECTFLPMWVCHHIPSPTEQENIWKHAQKMDLVRELLGKQFLVHVWMRPAKLNLPGHRKHGQDYNRAVYEKYVWGKRTPKPSQTEMDAMTPPNSAHKYGLAVDGEAEAETPRVSQQKLLPKLKEWDLRMEDISGWLHLDSAPVKWKRFFRP